MGQQGQAAVALNPTTKDSSVVPHGMRQVTREEFWRAVMSERRNIHPRPDKHHTEWTLIPSQQMWGWTSRGYVGPWDHQGAPPEVFAIANEGGAS